jgi:hypothetical protein
VSGGKAGLLRWHRIFRCLRRSHRKLPVENPEARLPHGRESLAPGVFHFHCNWIATRILYAEFCLNVQALVSGVPHSSDGAVEQVLAAIIVSRGGCYSATMLFHSVCLFFTPVPARWDHEPDEDRLTLFVG